MPASKLPQCPCCTLVASRLYLVRARGQRVCLNCRAFACHTRGSCARAIRPAVFSPHNPL